jgi:iron complex outermembrane receptor protein
MVCFGTKKMICLILLAMGLLAQAGLSPAWSEGQRSSSDSELLLSDAPIMVTTATKTAQRASDAPAAVTVIDEETIRLSGATTIPDLLKLVPGVNVTQVDQTEYDISARGLNTEFANKMLVMVDGRSIYQDFFGNIWWTTTPLLISRIKRIEVVRGPGSALYGANAFNGVINIITKTPQEMRDSQAPATVRIAGGTHNSLYSEVTDTTGKEKDWALTVGGGYNETDGYGDRKPGNIRDGYQVPIVTMDAEKDLSRGSLIVSTGGSQGKVDLPTPFELADDGDWNNYYASMTYSEQNVRNPFMARFYTDSAKEQLLPLSPTSGADIVDRRADFEVQQETSPSRRHDLVYGASYLYSTSRAFIIGPQWHGSDLWSAYAQDEYHAGHQTSLFTGLRYDDNSRYGSDVTPRVSLVHHLENQQALRLSYSTAFRAPTVLDAYTDTVLPLFGGLTETVLGNTALKPEKIASLEAGYRKDYAAGYVAVTAYDNWIRDLISFEPIQFAPSPPFPPNIPTIEESENFARAHATGMEFESEYRLAPGVKTIFNWSYEDMTSGQKSTTDLTPHDTVNVALQADLKNRFTGFLSVHSVSSVLAPDAATGGNAPIGAFTQVDARIGHRFGPEDRPIYLSVGATNLFNDGHLEYPNVPGPGGIPTAARHDRTLWVMIDGKL